MHTSEACCRGCGHPRSQHWHYREGTDCGQCGCNRYVLAFGEAIAVIVLAAAVIALLGGGVILLAAFAATRIH